MMPGALRGKYIEFLDISPSAGFCAAAARWLLWLGLVVAFAARIWLLKGFYIVAYALGIFNLNLLLGFLSPQARPIHCLEQVLVISG